MIRGKWIRPGESLVDILPLREAIFQTGRDALDDESWNALIFDGETPAAIGRIWWADGSFRLGMIGVLADHQGRGLGDLVIRLLLFKAQQHSAQEVALCCPAALAPFFAKYGFQAANPPQDPCLMTLSGRDICLDRCQGCPHPCE